MISAKASARESKAARKAAMPAIERSEAGGLGGTPRKARFASLFFCVFLGVPPTPPASLRSMAGLLLLRCSFERSEAGGLGGTPRESAPDLWRYASVAHAYAEGDVALAGWGMWR